MSLLEGIEKWAAKQPTWVGDALRRLWAGELTDSDKSELVKLVKKANHIEVPDAVTPSPFKVTAKAEGGDATKPKRLKKIHSLHYVNRIKDDAEIPFEANGLTIIYGDNASGKTGFGRVFKRACLARHTLTRVLPNVFDQTAKDKKAEATFDLVDNEGTESSVSWADGDSEANLLPNVAVFDRECARIQVTDSNDVFFLPYGAFLFSKLAALYGELSGLIDTELLALPQKPSALTRLNQSGASARFAAGITAKTTDAQIDAEIVLTQAEQTKHTTLAKVVNDRKLKTPAKLAAEYRIKATRFSKLADVADDLFKALSQEAADKAKVLYQQAVDANEAARIASQTSFSTEPIKGVGSSPWRTMFEAARQFAEQVAYPEKKFIETFEDKCVLCQQKLGEDASIRLKKFEAFVKDETAKTSTDKSALVTDAIASLKTLDKNYIEEYAELLTNVQELSTEHHAAITSFLNACDVVRKALVDGLNGKGWSETAPVVEIANTIAWLRERKLALEKEATAIESQKPSPEQLKEEEELVRLNDRKLMADNADGIKKYRDGLQVAVKLTACKKALHTKAVSDEQSRLLDQVVTEALQKALAEELDNFGLTGVEAKLIKKTSKAQISHKIQLQGVPPTVDITGLLSDGEGSVLAMASFVAEVRQAPNISVIALDDPVTSLDHLWREKIARRFAALAKGRQVIVFTHDIYFMNELWSQAEDQGICAKLRHAVGIVNNQAGVLLPQDSHPLEIIAPSTLAKRLKEHAGNSRKLLKIHDQMSNEYRMHVAIGYDLLRSAWERVIEHTVFGDVVNRFKKNVAFTNLKRVVIGLTREECVQIEAAMKKASNYVLAHSKSSAERVLPPTPDEFEADIKEMTDFLAALEKKRKDEAVPTVPVETAVQPTA